MPKTIRIDTRTYERLEQFRGKRETFTKAVDRLLTLLDRVGALRPIIEGGSGFEKWGQTTAAKQTATDAGGDRAALSNVQTREVEWPGTHMPSPDVQIPDEP